MAGDDGCNVLEAVLAQVEQRPLTGVGCREPLFEVLNFALLLGDLLLELVDVPSVGEEIKGPPRGSDARRPVVIGRDRDGVGEPTTAGILVAVPVAALSIVRPNSAASRSRPHRDCGIEATCLRAAPGRAARGSVSPRKVASALEGSSVAIPTRRSRRASYHLDENVLDAIATAAAPLHPADRERLIRDAVARLRAEPTAGPNRTFPTGPLILEFCRKNASRIKGRCGGNACSEDLPSFRILLCA